MTKPREKTHEELTAEIEDGKKKIRQFENREKMLRQKLSKEERRTRSHRLIVRGAVFESIVPEAKNMTDEEAAALLRLALTSEPAREYLKKEQRERQAENPLGTKGALIHPNGRVRSAEGLSPHRELSPRSDMAALPQQGAAPLAPLLGYPCALSGKVHPLRVCTFPERLKPNTVTLDRLPNTAGRRSIILTRRRPNTMKKSNEKLKKAAVQGQVASPEMGGMTFG